jgi:hypothetical protein
VVPLLALSVTGKGDEVRFTVAELSIAGANWHTLPTAHVLPSEVSDWLKITSSGFANVRLRLLYCPDGTSAAFRNAERAWSWVTST